jgi:hypothetical protein
MSVQARIGAPEGIPGQVRFGRRESFPGQAKFEPREELPGQAGFPRKGDSIGKGGFPGPGTRRPKRGYDHDGNLKYFYSGGDSDYGLPGILPDPAALYPRRPKEQTLQIGRLGLPIIPDSWLTEKPEKAPRGKDRAPKIPRSLGTELEYLKREGFLHFLARNRRLFRKFSEIIGTQYAGKVEACGKQLGMLYVRVDSPHLAERCHYMKKEWMKILNIEMGEEVVTDMFFRVLQPGDPYPELKNSGPPSPKGDDEDDYRNDR